MIYTELNNSLKDFRYQVCYLNNPSDIDNIEEANIEDVLYVKCYPKWNISEKELKDSVEKNKNLLLNDAKKVANDNDLFYCHFEIDFKSIYGSTIYLDGNRVRWYEVRPEIKKVNVDDHSRGFINAGELPPEN